MDAPIEAPLRHPLVDRLQRNYSLEVESREVCAGDGAAEEREDVKDFKDRVYRYRGLLSCEKDGRMDIRPGMHTRFLVRRSNAIQGMVALYFASLGNEPCIFEEHREGLSCGQRVAMNELIAGLMAKELHGRPPVEVSQWMTAPDLTDRSLGPLLALFPCAYLEECGGRFAVCAANVANGAADQVVRLGGRYLESRDQPFEFYSFRFRSELAIVGFHSSDPIPERLERERVGLRNFLRPHALQWSGI